MPQKPSPTQLAPSLPDGCERLSRNIGPRMPHLYCHKAAGWLAACLLSLHAAAQPATDSTAPPAPRPTMNYWRHELLVTSENDNYVLQLRDGYYTNGLSFRFSWAGGTRHKQVWSAELGQHIFNPVRYDSINLATQDRPFAGYLYGSLQRRHFSRPGRMMAFSATVGTIGPRSGAEQVQRWYHGIIGIYDVEGWPNQLRNEWSLNLGWQMAHTLLKGAPASRGYDVAATAQAHLGNALTNASTGVLLRAGKMEDYANSAHFDGRVSRRGGPAPGHRKEFYFFIHPMLTWQGYHAALQGGLFTDDKGPKTAELRPWVFSQQIGFKLAQNRWTLGMHYIARSRQAEQQLRKERFISIQIAYRTGKYQP